jgi:surface antigen
VPIQSMLSDAIMNMLDCDEQRKAADATQQLTQQAERGEVQVGSRVEWQSETRTGVTGAAVVTQVDAPPAAGGQQCMTVTDVVIVDGEETTVPKQMCRTPPSTRWARA